MTNHKIYRNPRTKIGVMCFILILFALLLFSAVGEPKNYGVSVLVAVGSAGVYTLCVITPPWGHNIGICVWVLNLGLALGQPFDMSYSAWLPVMFSLVFAAAIGSICAMLLEQDLKNERRRRPHPT